MARLSPFVQLARQIDDLHVKLVEKTLTSASSVWLATQNAFMHLLN